jgi:hypothetical protein
MSAMLLVSPLWHLMRQPLYDTEYGKTFLGGLLREIDNVCVIFERTLSKGTQAKGLCAWPNGILW